MRKSKEHDNPRSKTKGMEGGSTLCRRSVVKRKRQNAETCPGRAVLLAC